MAETGKKMGDYTPLESNKKEYFLGEGEGGVVAVGKTDAGGSKTNRLVKLSDIAGDKLPSGGTEGQVLTKTSSGEAWADAPSGLPSGGTNGQVLTKTASGNEWADAPKELPSSGSAGQFLKKTENGVEYASVSEVPSGGTTGQVLVKTANGVEWGNSEVVKFTGTLNPDANPPDYTGMPSAADVKAAIQAGKHVILSLDDTTGHPVQYFYTHSHGDFDFYFVGFPRMNTEGTPIYNRTYISAVNTIQSGADSMGWTANKYLFANWPLTDGGVPTGNAGDVLAIIADKWGTKSMTWATPSAGLPSGGSTGQVLTKTANGNEWADAPTELPSSGTAGQFLKKTTNGVEYASVNQVPTSGMTGDVLKKTASGYEFSDANEVPANGTEGDVLTKGAEGYSWAPRMLYKHDSKLEGDTVEITNKTITKMNIDVHSATTFNITTDDVTNMPNAIVEIFVDPGSSLTEIAFTLTWTITSGQYAGVRTLYGPAAGNTVQVNAGDVIQIHIYDSCWNAFKFIQPVSPTPSYEYVVLQNFVAGHSIGTPSTGEFVTTVPDDWSSLWQADGDETMFDDTNPNAPLIDNRSPIDCSKYGINSGTPVATISCNYESESDWPWAGFDIDNGNLSYPLTEETFFTCRNSESINQHFIMILGNDRYFVEHYDTELFIGLCLSTHTYEDDEYHDENKYCRVYLTNNHLTYHRIANFNPDEVGEPVDDQGTIPAGKVSMATWLSSWHHFAFTIDASNLYVFVDGKCYATIPLSNTYVDEVGTTTKTLGEWIASMPSKVCITPNEAAGSGMNMAGLWAQFAVCKACKWTTDFTVPTEAY